MLNNITTETIFYFPQISNTTFKGRRNGAGSHDKKYCKRRATDTQGGSPKNFKLLLESNKWTVRKLSGEVSDITKNLEYTRKQLEVEAKVIKKDIETS